MRKSTIETRPPFTVVEQPPFRNMFDFADINVPVRSADTPRNRIKDEHYRYRDFVKQELDKTCRTAVPPLNL